MSCKVKKLGELAQVTVEVAVEVWRGPFWRGHLGVVDRNKKIGRPGGSPKDDSGKPVSGDVRSRIVS